ncbi:MAG: PP2C family protein-serine/threonine phosphatase [Sciscionella sp.]
MTLVLRYAARSDRGLVRSNNQDSVYAGPRLLAVADGMGGHAAGEVASKIVIAAMAPLDDDEPGEDLINQLIEAVQSGNGAISELVAGEPEMDGMGTTLTAVLFAGSRLGIAHVGDSRAYLLRGGTLSQITHDDSFVQSLVDEGRITSEEAATHPQRSLLLKALTGNEVEVHPTIREARAGDRYLLCSDGLSGFVSHETLTDAIQISDPGESANRMIELALKAGGADNVTVIIADVVDVDFGEDAPIIGGAAGDGSDEGPPPDSPASRAQALSGAPAQPRRIEPTEEVEPGARRRKRLRIAALVGIVVLVLAAAAFATRYWVLQQYYVAADSHGEVSIFQGVRGTVLGIALHHKVEGSCQPESIGCEVRDIGDFRTTAQAQLQQGIPVDSLQGARAKISQLQQEYLLPLCTQTPPATGTRTPPSGRATPSTTTRSRTTTNPVSPPSPTAGRPSGAGTPGQEPLVCRKAH